MKTCFKCGRSLPISAFYRHPSTADGHLGKCADCTRLDVAAHRARNLASVRSYDRARDVGERAVASRAAASAWSRAHPAEARAQQVANRAIRSGALKRGPCEFCSAPHANAHHDDYSKPLAVRWICLGVA